MGNSALAMIWIMDYGLKTQLMPRKIILENRVCGNESLLHGLRMSQEVYLKNVRDQAPAEKVLTQTLVYLG